LKVGLDSSVLIASVKRVGEKYHRGAVELARRMADGGHQGVCSALVATELPGALLSSTTMPIERAYEVHASTLSSFRASVMTYEPYLTKTTEMMIEFRRLKARWEIGSADFHHLATAVAEGCSLFVTTDEKHLLRRETREELSGEIELSDPDHAAKRVR